MDENTWIKMMDEKILILDNNLSESDKSRYKLDLLKRIIYRADQFKDQCDYCLSLQDTLNSIVDDLRNLESKKRSFRNNYNNNLNEIVKHFREVHNLVEKGYHASNTMIFGMILGVSLGIAFGNLAIGIGAGMAIGAGVGASKDKTAERENRVL